MKNIRLKSALQADQIADRLKYRPEILEIQLNEEDLYCPQVVVDYIRDFKSRGIKVYLHHPTRFRGRYMDIISSSREMRDYYDWSSKEIASICKQEQVKCIIHCHYAQSESSLYSGRAERLALRKRVEGILAICDRSFLWEDTIRGIFSAENPYLFSEIVGPLDLSLNIDISHSFIALRGSNARLRRHLDIFAPHARYYHIVDSKGQNHDGLPLGQGRIDWEMVKSYVGDTDFIFEIDLKCSDYKDCIPMIESAEYWNRI
ncbi:TIM barrel protein [Bacillus marasmi]|uniref:TIM barrel protein n=1 Tax=Bacillus marasmi TaxID=1926279 RepID=UPI0011CC552F|nr:TIM barrel protein [Bacillus marasmi]